LDDSLYGWLLGEVFWLHPIVTRHNLAYLLTYLAVGIERSLLAFYLVSL